MYKRQIHEGADARKIDEKYLTGQIRKGSWKVEENRMIKKQNALLQKVIATFGKVSGALSMWRECLNDIRRKQRSNSHAEWNMTVYDAHVNLLRSQTEAMSAALAGVDSITVRPFEDVYKRQVCRGCVPAVLIRSRCLMSAFRKRYIKILRFN